MPYHVYDGRILFRPTASRGRIGRKYEPNRSVLNGVHVTKGRIEQPARTAAFPVNAPPPPRPKTLDDAMRRRQTATRNMPRASVPGSARRAKARRDVLHREGA